ncbi:lamina-associated polypeptide 2-like [Bufo gargarizans]|uniref:lamina-associated polypeptide 2-like n=1 Tax=Bufo gargarizans TaxID=30331 RepID=UPI001CF5385B|nr:lamina-associated polypeptide 2-like [Bufo gargarizans]XP_044151087.1 lamina-associated polypeptide 2-like [Bufo gargarizans]XP_044155183.1 lamina-associated polypeptide 2-like [Bufo gargarizans]
MSGPEVQTVMELDAPPLPPAKEAQKKLKKPPRCISCARKLPDDYGKKLCKACISDVIQEEQSSLMENIRSVVQEEIRAARVAQSDPQDEPSRKRPRSRIFSSGSEDAGDKASTSTQWEDDPSLSEGEVYENNKKFYFSSEEMNDLLKAVRATMGIEETPRSVSIQDEMFGGLKVKKSRVFPINEHIRQMILEEWSEPEKRLGISKEFKNRLLFDPSQSKLFDGTPKVDVQVAKVNKKTALPFEDAAQLKDTMERKADALLRKAWEASMFNIKTNIAATSVARSMYLWLGELENHLSRKTSREEILQSIPLLKSATGFLADASAESIRFCAREAGLSNAARRTLWMKSWSGDRISKLKLISIPFSGEYVFGPVLDEILEKAADKKKGFPEERSFRKNQSFRSYGGQNKSVRGKGKSGRWSYPKGGRGRGFLLKPQSKSEDKQ